LPIAVVVLYTRSDQLPHLLPLVSTLDVIVPHVVPPTENELS